jgi:mannose/cellobiose epimerase-like protein (N-acyl-D-glucosamine 2-epimerase family)
MLDRKASRLRLAGQFKEMRMQALLVLAIVFCALPVRAAVPPAVEVERVRVGLERILNENIVPFWYPQVIDEKNGGYQLNHDSNGTFQGPSDKALVTQARTVWFFSRLYNSGYGGPEHLAAAEHGYAFLRDQLWDDEFGGFVWSVDATGQIATRPHKHLYAQGFALYALTEFATASKKAEAAGLAAELFYLLEEKAHDATYGGYMEWFRRDWGPGPKTGTYMSTPIDGKLMNTHLHLLEPFTTYAELSGDDLVRERLIELILVQSNAVLRKELGACTDKYARDWTPLLDPAYARVSYGHDIENVWLLIEACRAAGLPNGPLTDLYRQLVDYALRYGFDHERGGFYDAGNFAQPADAKAKVWWVQAEGLVALLYMYELTGELKYWQAFVATYDWIEGQQVDWRHGDWHASVAPSGVASGAKANAWKSPYHNGRAVLKCLQILTQMNRGASTVE